MVGIIMMMILRFYGTVVYTAARVRRVRAVGHVHCLVALLQGHSGIAQ